MHARAASNPQESTKAGTGQSGTGKTSSRPQPGRLPATTASSSGEGQRRNSLFGPRPPLANKENQASKSTDASTKPSKPEPIKVDPKKQVLKSVDIPVASKTSTSARAAENGASPLARKSTNKKAFQSSISPLMHFDEPALPTVFAGLRVGGISGGGEARSVSGPAAMQQQVRQDTQQNVAYPQAGYLSVPTSPTFYNPSNLTQGFSSLSGLVGLAGGYYYMPNTDSPFLPHPQGFAIPSPPGTPATTTVGTFPNDQDAAASAVPKSLYPPSLGLGHPFLVAPSANSSLSMSSVPSLFSNATGSMPGSRNTSFGSVADTSGHFFYPIPYMYTTPDPATTMRERLEGGAVLSSKGACKFFDVEKGFGFIIDDHAEELGADVFVHYTGIEQLQGFRCLAQNERVEYTIVKHTSGRFQALKVRGENGAPLRGLDDPRQLAAFERMNSKAAALWSEDEEDVRPPPRFQRKGRRMAPAYVGNMRAPPPRIKRTPPEEEEE